MASGIGSLESASAKIAVLVSLLALRLTLAAAVAPVLAQMRVWHWRRYWLDIGTGLGIDNQTLVLALVLALHCIVMNIGFYCWLWCWYGIGTSIGNVVGIGHGIPVGLVVVSSTDTCAGDWCWYWQ